MGGIEIVRGSEKDAEVCFEIFQKAVMELTRDDYTLAQRIAWAGESMDRDRWLNRMSENKVFLAKKDDTILGFAELKENMLIDMMYVLPGHARHGVGESLLKAVEHEVRQQDEDRISAYISRSARPFFEKRGFTVSWENQIERSGELLTNFLMVKDLR